MGTVHQLRPASVSVFATERDDRPVAIQIESASSTSSAVLTRAEAMAVHSMLGQFIRAWPASRRDGMTHASNARALEGLLADERDDAERAAAELEHDTWASGQLANLIHGWRDQIQGRGSNKTSEGHRCSATSKGAGHVRARAEGEHATCLPAHAPQSRYFQTSSDAFARTAGAVHTLAPALTGGGIEGVCVGHDGACGMVSPRLLHTQSRAADGSESGTPRAGEEG